MTWDEAKELPVGTRVLYTPPNAAWPAMCGTVVGYGLRMVHVEFSEMTRAIRPALLRRLP